MSRKATALLMVALVALSAVSTAAVATGTNTQEASAYTGTHVSFDVQQKAIADYQVEGTTVFEELKVQSGSSGNADGVFGGSAELSALTSIEGSALSLGATANAHATVSASGSAKMTAHDNTHGILVVKAGSDDQAVVANLSSGASASAESGSQVAVTTESGTEGTFIVVGDGSVAVNGDGDVSAKLSGDSRLVFRAYAEGKSDSADKTEELIASGEATGEVYFDQQDGEMVADTVTYSQEMSVQAEQSAENTVTVTADRASSEGKVIITSVSEAAVGTTSDLSVKVDGNATAKVSSYSELKGAIGSDSSKYMVKQASSASAKANVLVAVNHFSERTMTMSGQDGGSGDSADTGNDGGSGGSDGGSGGSVPGFGVGVALVALVGAALAAYRR